MPEIPLTKVCVDCSEEKPLSQCYGWGTAEFAPHEQNWLRFGPFRFFAKTREDR